MAARILPLVSVGSRFGRWLVVGQAESRLYGAKEQYRWSCRCDCGVERDVLQLSLKNGSSTSCGCFNREVSARAHTTHGATAGHKKSPEYKAWSAMHERCQNPRNKRYGDYGGRGIKVCERWKSFENFLADMGERPSVRHSLDREKNDLGYDAGNCRWALPHTQMTNRSVTRFVEIEGQSVPLATLAKQYDIPANTLRFRILKGWPLDEALSKPVRPKAKAA